MSVCQSNCGNLFFCKTTDLFYATKENNVAQFKIKVEIDVYIIALFQNVLVNSYQIALSSQFV